MQFAHFATGPLSLAFRRKSRTPEGLTEEEKAEQAALRREYVDAVKESLQGLRRRDIRQRDLLHPEPGPARPRQVLHLPPGLAGGIGLGEPLHRPSLPMAVGRKADPPGLSGLHSKAGGKDRVQPETAHRVPDQLYLFFRRRDIRQRDLLHPEPGRTMIVMERYL